MKAVYLAGPDVFRVDSVAHGTYLKALCEQHGLVGKEAATWICQQNMAMIARADAVIAMFCGQRRVVQHHSVKRRRLLLKLKIALVAAGHEIRASNAVPAIQMHGSWLV